MNPLSAAIYFIIGLITWYLALRRTLACVRGQRLLVSSLVFVEEILGFIVIYFLVVDKNWIGAIFYAVGGALGAYLVNGKKEKTTQSTSETESNP
jgi:uncharacterized protein YebE (UPF0316 family)